MQEEGSAGRCCLRQRRGLPGAAARGAMVGKAPGTACSGSWFRGAGDRGGGSLTSGGALLMMGEVGHEGWDARGRRLAQAEGLQPR